LEKKSKSLGVSGVSEVSGFSHTEGTGGISSENYHTTAIGEQQATDAAALG
jgi:hypothetical protein